MKNATVLTHPSAARPGPDWPFISPSQNPAAGAARQIEPKTTKNMAPSVGRNARKNGASASGMTTNARNVGLDGGGGAGVGSSKASTVAFAGTVVQSGEGSDGVME